jgi:D-alanine-D-alanine ligase
MSGGRSGFIPVLHAATTSRPDEIDTLAAAEAVAGALGRLGYTTDIVGLGADFGALKSLAARRPLAVFNLVDAVNGDGRLAAFVPLLLELDGLAFTGASSNAWIRTLSKIGAKEALAHAGLPTPAWSKDGSGLRRMRAIVKPVWEHGSLGLDATSVMSASKARRAILEWTFRWKSDHFVEAFIEGREFNVSLLDGREGVQVLPIAEILFEGFGRAEPKIVGYDAKWRPDSVAYVGTPRRFGLEGDSPERAARLKTLALACWSLFGLSGYARVDFRVDPKSEPFILEVNVNPCLSPDAGFAAAAAEAGLGYDAMISRIVESSLGALRATA